VARTRDFRAEYRRRIVNAAKRGLSRSQARGHARANEAPVRSTPIAGDKRLEDALKLLRQTGNQGRAAKEFGISAERFRRFLRANGLAERQGQKWTITDNRSRHMTVITGGEAIKMDLRDFPQSSLNSQHLNAVQAFLRTNDIDLLRPFEGRSVIDAKGTAHLLEIDPNALYRLAHAGGEAFHEVYRLNV
jgi:hypothetical protein